MADEQHPYHGPAGVFFTEQELRELSYVLHGQSSPMRDALAIRVSAYLHYLDATRTTQDRATRAG